MSDLQRVQANDPDLEEVYIEEGDDDNMLDFRLALRDNTVIKKLYIGTVYLIDDDMEMLVESAMPLEELTLVDNGMIKERLRDLRNVFMAKTMLTTVEIRENNVDSDTLRTICLGLTHCKDLDTLFLESNKIGSAGGMVLAQLLRTNPKLAYLDLKSNELDDDAVIDLCTGIGPDSNLRELSLSQNKLHGEAYAALGHMLSLNTNLNILELDGGMPQSSGVSSLCRGLVENNTLSVLTLAQNNLGDVDMLVLCHYSPRMNLVKLNLGDNAFGEVGAKKLFSVMASNTSLEGLDVSSNNLSPKCQPELLQMLRTNVTLTELYLGRNPLGDKCCAAIFKTLLIPPRTSQGSYNDTLKVIDLDSTGCGRETIDVLCHVLRVNTTLEAVNIYEPDLVIPEKLILAIERSRTLKFFRCWSQPERIDIAIDRNRHNIDVNERSLVSRLLGDI